MATRKSDTTESTDSAVNENLSRALTRMDIRSVKSVADAIALFDGKVSEAADMLGDGCELIKAKDQLVDKPFLILEARQISGDFGAFYTVAAILEDGRKVRFSDGSTGIYRQLLELAEDAGNDDGTVSGLMCRHGLTRSDYTYTDDNGVEHPASTYYIELSA